MLKTLAIVVLLLVAVPTAAMAFGAYHWRAGIRDLLIGLDAARTPMAPQIVDFREFEDLPVPVQRYFRAVLKEGQPMIAAATVELTGTFNMSATDEQWKPFTSRQRVVTRRPAFLWDAQISMLRV